jgi:hypothetical protein
MLGDDPDAGHTVAGERRARAPTPLGGPTHGWGSIAPLVPRNNYHAKNTTMVRQIGRPVTRGIRPYAPCQLSARTLLVATYKRLEVSSYLCWESYMNSHHSANPTEHSITSTLRRLSRRKLTFFARE